MLIDNHGNFYHHIEDSIEITSDPIQEDGGNTFSFALSEPEEGIYFSFSASPTHISFNLYGGIFGDITSIEFMNLGFSFFDEITVTWRQSWDEWLLAPYNPPITLFKKIGAYFKRFKSEEFVEESAEV